MWASPAGQIPKMQLANPEDPNMVELYESVRALPQQEFIEKDHFAGYSKFVYQSCHNHTE